TWDDITDLEQFALTGSELLQEVNRRFKEALVAGVEQVATFARGISNFDVFHVQVPLLGGTVGDYLDLGGMLQRRLTDPPTTHLMRLPPDAFPTLSGMLKSLGIRATVQDGNLRLQFGDEVEVSFTNNELVVNFAFDAERTVPIRLDLGLDPGAVPLQLAADLN